MNYMSDYYFDEVLYKYLTKLNLEQVLTECNSFQHSAWIKNKEGVVDYSRISSLHIWQDDILNKALFKWKSQVYSLIFDGMPNFDTEDNFNFSKAIKESVTHVVFEEDASEAFTWSPTSYASLLKSLTSKLTLTSNYPQTLINSLTYLTNELPNLSQLSIHNWESTDLNISLLKSCTGINIFLTLYFIGMLELRSLRSPTIGHAYSTYLSLRDVRLYVMTLKQTHYVRISNLKLGFSSDFTEVLSISKYAICLSHLYYFEIDTIGRNC